MEDWLFHAASTGSSIAAEDLAKIDLTRWRTARAEFKTSGGYNEALMGTAGKFRNVDVKEARDVCDLKGAESSVDLCGNKLIHIAAMFGKIDVVHYLVEERGVSINSRNDAGETALYKACLAGQFHAVKALVSMSADASITSQPFQISCLHWLFNFDLQHIEPVAKLLVSKGAHVKARTAAIMNDKQRLHIPFEHFPFHWPLGTPFHWASFTRSIEAMDVLLSLGADVDDLDSNSDDEAQTALAMAMYRADTTVVRYLLSKESDPRRVDGTGRNPFHMLAIEWVLSNNLFRLPKCIQWWVYHGSIDKHLEEVWKAVLAVQEAGGALDGRRGPSMSENTALLDAAGTTPDGGPVVAFLKAGASVQCVETFSGKLPLHLWAGVYSRKLAYQDTYELVCRALLDRTDDWNAKDILRGHTFLHSAVLTHCQKDFEYFAKLLLTVASGVSIDVRDHSGATPLLLALNMKGFDGEEAESRVNFLRQFHPNIDAQDDNGRDFIWTICDNYTWSDTRCLRMIKSRLGSLDSTSQRQILCASKDNQYQQTALMRAVQSGLRSCVELFLSVDVEINDVDKNCNTALDLALTAGEEYRRKYLSTWWYNGQLTDQMEPRNAETLFTLTFTESDLGESLNYSECALLR